MKTPSGRALPWWTWVLPLLICHLGTRISLFFEIDITMALFYWPVALGLVMALWWGPRVLVGVFLNAVLSAPLWMPLPLDQMLLWGIPETLGVAMGWFLFSRILPGKINLPDFQSLMLFLALGIGIVSVVSGFFFSGMVFLSGQLTIEGFLGAGEVLWLGASLDLLMVTLPILVFFSAWMDRKGWSVLHVQSERGLFSFSAKKPPLHRVELGLIFSLLVILGLLLPFEKYWVLYGAVLIMAAVRFGFGMAISAQTLTQFMAHYWPVLLARILNRPELAAGGNNFNLLFGLVVSGVVALIVGRAVSDLSSEISQRQEAEDALRRSERRFRALIENSSEGIAIIDAEGRREFISSTTIRLSGIQPDVLMEKKIGAYVHPDDLALSQQTLQEVRATPGSSRKIQLRSQKGDGEYLWIESTVTNLINEPSIAGIVINSRDISAEKEAQQALLESSRNLEDALRVARMAYWILDLASGRFQFADAFYAMLGTSAVEAGGYEMALEDFIRRHVLPKDEQEMKEKIAQAIASDRSDWHTHVERQIRRSDGSLFWASIWFRSEKDSTGRTVRLFGVNQDISESKRREAIQAARLRLLQFAESHTLNQLLQATLDELGELTGSPIGFYHFVDADQKSLSLQAWSSRTLHEFCTADPKVRHYPLEQAGVWADCARERRAIIHNDYASLPNRKGMPEGHARVVRELVVPVLRGERVAAILGVGNKAVDYGEEEIELATQFADMAWDIAERKREQELNQANQARMKAVFDFSGIGLAVLDTHGAWMQCNQCFEQLVGYSETELQALTNLTVTHPDDMAETEEKMAALVQGQVASYRIEKRFLHKSGRAVWVDLSVTPLNAENGQILAMLSAAVDITERKQAEEVIQRRSRELVLLAEASHELSRSLEFAEGFHALRYFLPGAMPCDSYSLSSYDTYDRMIRCLAVWNAGEDLDVSNWPAIPLEEEGKGTQSQVIHTGEPLLLNDYLNYQRTARTAYYIGDDQSINNDIPESEDLPRSALIVPLKAEGKIVGVLQVFSRQVASYTLENLRLLESFSLHISSAMVNAGLFRRLQEQLEERQRTAEALQQGERQLRASLEEKNALIKEIHHRVKNNMQVMISLLSLQRGQMADQKIRDLFLDSENRIRSMALVHEQLYRSSSLSNIDFGAYLQRLVGDLHSAYNTSSQVRMEVQAQAITLPIETAVPCGLLVNELVTNALKHAFPGGRSGVVSVSLAQQQDEVMLTVSDDGVGLPPTLQPGETDTLGLKLIQLLASQLDGRLEWGRSVGTQCCLRFQRPDESG